jgi:hypothetical protein
MKEICDRSLIWIRLGSSIDTWEWDGHIPVSLWIEKRKELVRSASSFPDMVRFIMLAISGKEFKTKEV